MQYAFYFDSRSCSGCQACQIACRDKHGLTAGQSWRRVHEVSGGTWQQAGSAWVPDLFAYHLSIACNHCEQPICVEVCPARALTKRDDGIVLLDAARCLGCGYCSWACPYDALHLDPQAGHMTKCTFCADKIDAGQPPECVAACPLRVLDFGDRAALAARRDAADGYLPLPDPALTQPALLVHPHQDAERSRSEAEPVFAGRLQNMKEGSLVAFTMLAQTAVGGLWTLGLLTLLLGSEDMALLRQGGGLIMEVVAVVGLAVSLLHLGRWQNAQHALRNLGSSWLSAEIGFAVSFVGANAALSGLWWLELGSTAVQTLLFAGVLLLGAGLVYSMARLYMLRTVPAWNKPQTLLSFWCTTLLTGGVGITAVSSLLVPTAAAIARITVPASLALLLLLWGLRLHHYRQSGSTAPFGRLRLLLPLLGAVCLLPLPALANDSTWGMPLSAVAAFILIFSSEARERFRFYRAVG